MYVPVPQFHRIAEANGGVDRSQPPYRVFGLRRPAVKVPQPGAGQRVTHGGGIPMTRPTRKSDAR